jgi:hypothetical protein
METKFFKCVNYIGELPSQSFSALECFASVVTEKIPNPSLRGRSCLALGRTIAVDAIELYFFAQTTEGY